MKAKQGSSMSMWRAFLACCQGLVVVDKEVSSIQLIHSTLQEYLRAHLKLFGKAHSTMAETCLSYLNLPRVKALSGAPSPDLQGTPCLEYSSLYLGNARKKGPFRLRKNHLLLRYLMTRVPTYPPKSSWKHRNCISTLLVLMGFTCSVVHPVNPYLGLT